ncbi:hypothetical protein [Variovorax sp. TBS-050B]|uniref:hypothetical protein n=1 Tax=Variovorax sp. TBS-050B TaxID=2940551 RepID=UPI00247562E8|nr:hypothetical protein [Variovorax sp. TBS-050B]
MRWRPSVSSAAPAVAPPLWPRITMRCSRWRCISASSAASSAWNSAISRRLPWSPDDPYVPGRATNTHGTPARSRLRWASRVRSASVLPGICAGGRSIRLSRSPENCTIASRAPSRSLLAK